MGLSNSSDVSPRTLNIMPLQQDTACSLSCITEITSVTCGQEQDACEFYTSLSLNVQVHLSIPVHVCIMYLHRYA